MRNVTWISKLLGDALHAIEARVAELLSVEFDFDVHLGIDARDVDPQVKQRLFLGMYTKQTATQRLFDAGVLPAVELRVGGLVDVELDTEQGMLWIRKRGAPEPPLAEVRARLTSHGGGRRTEWDTEAKAVLDWETEPTRPALPAGTFLELDWMRLQNPFAKVPAGFAPLPAQRFPGLGIGRHVLRAIRLAARRLDRSAVLGTPMHFHNATMYRKVFVFCDPVYEGLFLALTRDLEPLGFLDAAWAVDQGRVYRRGDAQPFEWVGHAMIDPISDAHRAYVSSPEYVKLAAEVLRSTHFEVREAASARPQADPTDVTEPVGVTERAKVTKGAKGEV